ncbi:hypothetical protein ACH436_07530 [Isoptericola sp. NPDC019693]|uniref:hypothetical protein n=1 Tax=Isoptericola sp. NPDC019693 TaxID=3364009 RepID=UPI0037B50A81
MTDDPAPRPAEAAALLAQAEQVALVSRSDRVAWTLFAVGIGVLWGGFSFARQTLPGLGDAPWPYLAVAAVFAGLVLLLWWAIDGRSRTTPHIGWMTRMWPGPLPLLMYVPADLVVHNGGLDPTGPVVMACVALAAAMPCLAAAHRIWWNAWIPGRGER